MFISRLRRKDEMGGGANDRKVLRDFQEGALAAAIGALDDARNEASDIFDSYFNGDPSLYYGWEGAYKFLHNLLQEADSLSLTMLRAGAENSSPADLAGFTKGNYETSGT